jgi:hypothetical protein
MFDIIYYKANLNTFFLKKLDKNNKFVFNSIIVNNKLKSL